MNYLARLKAIVSEKRLPREPSKGSKVLTAGISEPSKPSKAPFEPFEGDMGGRVLKFEMEAEAPVKSRSAASEPPSPAASIENHGADVVRMLDGMAAENEGRRDWHAQPVEGWRDGRLELRNIVRGETNVIRLRPKRGHKS